MNKRQRIYKVIFCVAWIVGLSAITLVLFLTGGKGIEHYAKLGAVSILWFIFIVYLFGLQSIEQLKVLPAKFDQFILLIVLLIFFLIMLMGFIESLLRVNIIPAILFGLVGSGLINVIRSLVFAKG